MKELKVGEKIVLEVKENTFEDPRHPCKECFFFDAPLGWACESMCRQKDPNSDTVKRIIFKEVNK